MIYVKLHPIRLCTSTYLALKSITVEDIVA